MSRSLLQKLFTKESSGEVTNSYELESGFVLYDALYKVSEERMRSLGSGLELRMELNRNKPWVVFKLYCLYKAFISICARYDHSVFLERFQIFVVELVPVSVALLHHVFAICLVYQSDLQNSERICTYSHRNDLELLTLLVV